jgi:hypothetical protein
MACHFDESHYRLLCGEVAQERFKKWVNAVGHYQAFVQNIFESHTLKLLIVLFAALPLLVDDGLDFVSWTS